MTRKTDKKLAKQSKCFIFKNLFVDKGVCAEQPSVPNPTEYYLSVSSTDDSFYLKDWYFYDRDKLDKFWDRIVDYLYDEEYKKKEEK